jgi:hypothetical protein
MSKSQNDNIKKNKPPKVGYIDVSKIDDNAGIHSASDNTRHIERSPEKEVRVTEGNVTGSWQIKEKAES